MNFVEYVIINIDQLESRDRTSVRKIAAQNNNGCGCFQFGQARTRKYSCLCLYWWTWFEEIKVLLSTNTMGCIAHLIITLSGDVEKNPGPFEFTQISNAIIVHLIRTRMLHVPNKSIQFHYWNPDYLNLVEFQSMYWEMETVFSVRYHAS